MVVSGYARLSKQAQSYSCRLGRCALLSASHKYDIQFFFLGSCFH